MAENVLKLSGRPIDSVLSGIAARNELGKDSPIAVNRKPDGYSSLSGYEMFKYELSDKTKCLPVVVKLASKNKMVRKKFMVRERFSNEINFYSKAVPNIMSILEKWAEHNATRSLWIPKYYGHDLTDGSEWLVIEDAVVEFVNVPNPEEMDQNHLKTAMIALAVFHSAVLQWKSENSNQVMEIARSFYETEIPTVEFDPSTNAQAAIITAVLEVAQLACKSQLTLSYVTSLDNFINDVSNCSAWVDSAKSEPWSVITHGDCWAKNFLFKYDKDKKIIAVGMIDFKGVRYGSPLLDVTNFLLSSANVKCLNDLRPYIQKHKDSMVMKITTHREQVASSGRYGFVAGLVHHFSSSSLLPPMELVAEKIRTLENQTEDLRIAQVIKAAHDVRLI